MGKREYLTHPVNIGLIGCGRIALFAHLRALSVMDGVHVPAVADVDQGRREQAAEIVPEADLCADYHSLLERPDIQAVVICLPPSLHAQSAIDAFRAGKHVYLEKPIALNLPEAARVVGHWRESGKIGMMGFNFRHNALYVRLREQLQAGEIGELVAARSVFSSAARPLPPWKRKIGLGGGVLLDLGSHHADITRFLFNEEVIAARATVRSQRCEEDTAVLEMKLASGMVVSSLLSMSAVEEHRFDVYGLRGKLGMHRLAPAPELTLPTMAYDRIRRTWDALRSLHPDNLLRGPGEPSFAAALSVFTAAVRTGRQTNPDLDDGYRSLAIIEAARRSAASDHFVETRVPELAPVGSS